MATTEKGIIYPDDYTKVADVPVDMKKLAESVDTAIDNATKDLAKNTDISSINNQIKNINDKNTEQDDDIEALKKELDEQKAENERLRQDMNAYPSNTAEGEYITLNDSADSRFNKFTIKGNSVQKITTQSANLWSDNTTRTFDSSHRVQSVNLKPNIKAGTYKFSCDISNLVLGTNTGLHLASEIVYEDDSTDGSFYLIPNNAIKTNNTRYSNSITIEKNIKSIRLKVGATQTTNGGSMNVSNFCLRTDDSDEYIEFVPSSPSPDYKSDIQNVTGSINLFDGELETGSIDFSTGENIDGARVRSKNYIEIPVNTSRLCFIRTITGGLTGMKFYDENKNFISSYNNNREHANVQWFDVPQNTKYIRFIESVNNLNSKIKITTDLLSYKYSEPKKGIIYVKNTSRNFINQDEIGNYNNNISYISTLDDNSKKSTANLSNSRDAGTFLKLKKNTQYIVSLDIISITTENGSVRGAVEIMGHKFNTDTNIFGTILKQTAVTSVSIGQRFSTTFNSEDYDFWTLHISGWYGSGKYGIFVYKNVQVEEGSTATDFVDCSQEYEFPLAEGQVLRERDYLADDGIHHKRKQIELDGTETWFQNPNTKVFGFSVSDIDVEGAFNSSAKIIVMSNYFKASKYYQLYYGEVDDAISGHDSNQALEFRATRFATIDELKTWLAQKKAEGNPVIVEYDLKEETITPYTDEQQAVYDELVKTAKTYKTVTNIFSTNEISPVFEVEYRQDIKALITQQNQLFLEGGN